jgi:ferredoxin
MPDKYHINTKPLPSRRPRIGKFGVVDWREDCARCHNCVKKECIYDRYRQETTYIRNLDDVDAMYFECMGCFSCVQRCTKGILALSINPAYELLGNAYWTPEIIQTTWNQAETAAIPVSGAGYRGRFTGLGFDSMWTDMSEIVRPTRDGIHGREYISTAVDIGRKPDHLDMNRRVEPSPLADIPMPLVLDMIPAPYDLHNITPFRLGAAARTGLPAIMTPAAWQGCGPNREHQLSNVIFYLDSDTPIPDSTVLRQTRLVEIEAGDNVRQRIGELKRIAPKTVVAVRVTLDGSGVTRALTLARDREIEVIHLAADMNGREKVADKPVFIADMVREIHTTLVKEGIRDGITIIAGGGIALAEHMAKLILCGADAVTAELPLLLALECRLCARCLPGEACPARIDSAGEEYAVGRMTNLIAAWHNQLIEMMGAMGIREARRLRGETGRALFFNELEEETFGRLFGQRK